MAVYQTVTLSVDDWVDLNTAAGVAVGAGCVIQNISSGSCYLVDSATKPTRADGSLLFTPDFGQLSIAEIAAGSAKIWVRPVDATKTVKLIVAD
jgi:hypothetical protein